jgi:putative phosphoserine phosphatase / 1-acylglycerol-3-phosphate O-acyltransferase
MTTESMRLPGSVAEVAASPEGPQVGVFFDLDGTLIAGYSATHLARQRFHDREVGLSEVVRTLGVAVAAGLGRGAGFNDVMKLGAEAWRGRVHEDLEEMGERLFRLKIEPLIYPEMRELVMAHRERGHTVVLSSSATCYQVEPVARFLGVEHVLCNRYEIRDGVLTGEVVSPILWGSGKAEAVQRFAAEHDIDLADSYFYADGNEDLALMYLVGHPRPTNPGSQLEKVAVTRGWPVLRLRDPRSNPGDTAFRAADRLVTMPLTAFDAAMGAVTRQQPDTANSMVRNLVGSTTLIPAAAEGIAVGLFSRNRRTGVDQFMRRWSDSLFRACGVSLNVEGRRNLHVQRPAVFLFNHKNNFDIFVAGRLVGYKFTSVGKKEAGDNPIGAALGKLIDAVFIDREDTQSAVAALGPVQEAVAKGLSLVISPEGTRSRTGELQPFKKGPFRIAMAAGVPIVPIVIRNAEDLAPHDAKVMHPATIDVKVLAPISTAKWTLDELDERIAEVRQQYVDTLASW